MKTITFDDTKYKLVPIDQAETVTPGADLQDDDPTTKAQYRTMFNAACSALGEINEKLGLDHDDGGAEPIRDAIDDLIATTGGQPSMFWAANGPECSQNCLHNARFEIDCNRVLKVAVSVEVHRDIKST